MKRFTILLVTFAMIFSFVSVASLAQPSGSGIRGGGQGGYGPAAQGGPARDGVLGMSGLFRLDLTEEQRDQIQLLLREHQELVIAEREAVREQREAAVDAMAAIMDSDVFDEVGAYEILVQKAELGLELKMIRLSLQHQILHEILTEEQRVELQNTWMNQAAFELGVSQGPGPGEGLGDCPYM